MMSMQCGWRGNEYASLLRFDKPGLVFIDVCGESIIWSKPYGKESRKADGGRKLHMPFVQGIFHMHEPLREAPVPEVI